MRLLFATALLLSLSACSSGTPPAEAPAENGAPSGDGPESASTEPPPAAGPTMDSQRDPFVKSCMAKSRSKEYCECGFEQFKEVFKDRDLSQPIAADDPLVAELQLKTGQACGSKLSEAEIEQSFIGGCVEGDERKQAFCACYWKSMRKTLEPADFVGKGPDDPQFAEPKKRMVADCKGKYPADVARFDFMRGCTQGKAAQEKSCACKWDKVIKQFTVEELVAGTVDVAAAKGLANCK
jgi:hypothetical protein